MKCDICATEMKEEKEKFVCPKCGNKKFKAKDHYTYPLEDDLSKYRRTR